LVEVKVSWFGLSRESWAPKSVQDITVHPVGFEGQSPKK
jgi:hypothetical protein